MSGRNLHSTGPGALVVRTRLLDVMAGRFDRRLTLLTAGAGFGKSTLLEQSISDPTTVDRGPNLLVRLGPATDRAELLGGLLDAVRADPPPTPLDSADDTVAVIERVVGAMLSAAPARVTLVIDDAHHLEDDGWPVVEQLLQALPRNANVVVAGRAHGLRTARRLALGEAAEIDEAMLAFTPDELDEFARLRHVARAQLAGHGWPALAELSAAGGTSHAERFAAEEVLSSVPTDDLAVLRAAALHPYVDDDVIAALGSARRAADVVGPLPLTSSDDAGRYVLHDLWRDLLTRQLAPAERVAAHRRLGRHDLDLGRLRQAFEHMLAADDAAGQREVLLAYGRDFHLSNSVADRVRVHHALEPGVADTPAGVLLAADITFATDPMRAAPPLRSALDAAIDAGDLEVAALAVVRLGDLAYRSGDQRGLGEMRDRLESLSSDVAAVAPWRDALDAAAVLTEVWSHMLDNGAEKALLRLADPALAAYPPIAVIVDYYRAVQQGFTGRAHAALATIDQLRESPHGRILERLGGFASLMRWYLGVLPEDERAATTAIIERLGTDRQWHLFVEGTGTIALYHLSAGDTITARRLLAQAAEAREALPASSWGAITVELATAVLELLDGDEALAAARLDEVVPSTGPFAGFSRHVFGNVGAVIYALVPRTREFFDAETVGRDLAVATDVGRAVVALREQGDVRPAAALPWQEIDRLRTWAYEPLLLELALAARAGGNHRATVAVDTVVGDRRALLSRIVAGAERDGRAAIVDHAQQLLDATPARPDHVTEVRVLGTLDVRRDGVSLSAEPPMRRGTVRDLLMLLAHHRRLLRAEAIAMLWPDKNEKSGQNNLRTALSHLRTLLEADELPDNLPWHVRSLDDLIVLHRSDRLVVDAELFTQHLDRARAADRDRRPSDALTAYLDAIDLVRGDYAADVSTGDWAAHARLRFTLAEVEACTRASELLTAGTAVPRPAVDAAPVVEPLTSAIELADRAVRREPLSERAHRALIRARSASGDRAGALRCHQRVLELIDSEDLRPEPETVRLVAEL